MNAITEYLEKTKTTQTALAAQLGISTGALHHIISGKRKASPALARKIETLTAIPRGEIRPDIFGDAA